MRIIGLIFTMVLMAYSGGYASAQEDGDNASLVIYQAMTPALALTLAQETMAYCEGQGYQVAVTVVDRTGLTQVVLRDRYAGAHTIETSFRKAWTAVSFRTNTLDFAGLTESGQALSGIRAVSNAMAVGGGIPIEAAGSMVGGIGVSGAPGGDLDHECAQAGIDAIALELEF